LDAEVEVHRPRGQLETLQCGAKHVLDDDQLALGGNHDAAGRQRTVADAVAVVVKARARASAVESG
jgi:hypothetical protein